MELQYHKQANKQTSKQANTVDETISMKAEISILEEKNQNLVDLIIAGNGSKLMAIKSQEIEKQISALKWEVFTYRHKKVISPNLATLLTILTKFKTWKMLN